MATTWTSILCSSRFWDTWAGDIGEPTREFEYEPIEFPEDVPQESPPEPIRAPEQPDREPVPV